MNGGSGRVLGAFASVALLAACSSSGGGTSEEGLNSTAGPVTVVPALVGSSTTLRQSAVVNTGFGAFGVPNIEVFEGLVEYTATVDPGGGTPTLSASAAGSRVGSIPTGGVALYSGTYNYTVLNGLDTNAPTAFEPSDNQSIVLVGDFNNRTLTGSTSDLTVNGVIRPITSANLGQNVGGTVTVTPPNTGTPFNAALTGVAGTAGAAGGFTGSTATTAVAGGFVAPRF